MKAAQLSETGSQPSATPQLTAAGIGGPQMRGRGFQAWWPADKLAVSGYVEVLRHYRELVGIRNQLRERVLADYTTKWDEATIASLKRFAGLANEVMGGGYLDTVPAESFSTRFDPRK